MAFSSGKYYPETAAGNVFIGSTAKAGVALPVADGTAVTFGLWNTSTTKNAVLLSLGIGYTSGTIAVGEFGIANQDCGYALGTAAPLSVFTASAPKNALTGEGKGSAMKFTASAGTLTAGGTALMWLGQSVLVAGTVAGVQVIKHDFDGQVIVTPGQLVFVCGSIAQTGIYTMSLVWAEVERS